MTDAYADYLFDESRVVGHAEYIAFPQTEAELVSVVRYCDEHNLTLTAQGGLTGLTGGASPAGGLILNLSKMNRMLGMRKDADGTFYLRVEPGVLLTQVRKALSEKSFDLSGWDADSIEALRELKPGELFFSPDPTETTASLGGMAACNASGARSLLYGAMRVYVHGLRVVLADGRVTELVRGRDRAQGRAFRLTCTDGSAVEGRIPDFDTPRHVVDAGFKFYDDMDLVDLFVGSQGILGTISQLEVRLIPAPKLLWGATIFLPDDETALRFVRAMKGERLPGIPHFTHTPASLEFFNQRALDMVMAYKQESPAFQQLQALPEDYVCAVYVEFNLMHENRFLPILRELEQVVRAVGGDPERTWVARDSRELEKLLFFRHTVPEVTDIIVERNKKKEPCITILSTDMAVDDAHFDELFHIYQHDLSQTDLDWVIFGHIGENHVHPNIFARDRAEYEFGLRLFEKWAADVHRMDGTITGEHGTGKIKKKLAYIMYGPEKMAKLWQLKRTLDPKGLLGPGNILTEVEA